jgi:hypothetical protein
MDQVADVSPRGREPGLRAFMCSECGTVESVLASSTLIIISGDQLMENVEFRIMPNGKEGRWYWEVIKDAREVVARGVTDTEPAACEQAHEAAKKIGAGWPPVSLRSGALVT